MSQCLNWSVECSSQTKICQLDNSIVLDQQVLRLQVSVQDSMAVTKVNSIAELIHHTLHKHRIDSSLSELSHEVLHVPI